MGMFLMVSTDVMCALGRHLCPTLTLHYWAFSIACGYVNFQERNFLCSPNRRDEFGPGIISRLKWDGKWSLFLAIR
jgi:hypothetical protein